MLLSAPLRSVVGLSLLLSASAVAQVRFCLGGDLEHLTSAQRSACSAKLNAVRETAAAQRAPDDWHFVVVCGEQGWKSYSAFAFASETALATEQASTSVADHETFLRESGLDIKDSAALQHLIAQELMRLPEGQPRLASNTGAHKAELASSAGL